MNNVDEYLQKNVKGILYPLVLDIYNEKPKDYVNQNFKYFIKYRFYL